MSVWDRYQQLIHLDTRGLPNPYNSDLTITETLTVNGAVDFDSTLNVDGAVTFGAGATITGNVTITGSLNVTGTFTYGTAAYTNISYTGQLTSTIATGTAPMVITSTTVVANLNADLLDGYHWSTVPAITGTAGADFAGTLQANTITVHNGTTAAVYNTVATTVNFAGAATTLAVGAGAAATATFSFTTKINLDTGAIDSNQGTVAVLATPTAITMGAAATAVTIGKGTGATGTLSFTTALNLNSAAIDSNQATVALFATPTTITMGAAATTMTIGKGTGATGTLAFATKINANTAALDSNVATVALFATPTTLTWGAAATTVTLGGGVAATITLSASTIGSGLATVNLWNTTATTINFGGAATAVNIGKDNTATITLKAGTIATVATSLTLFGTTATTIALGAAATTFSVGAGAGATGTFAFTTGIALNTAAVTCNQTTLALFNTGVTTLNMGGAVTTFTLGAGAASTATLSFTTSIALNSAAWTTNQTTLAVANTTATTINAFGAATAITMGAAGASLTVGTSASTPVIYAGLAMLKQSSATEAQIGSDSTSAITVIKFIASYTGASSSALNFDCTGAAPANKFVTFFQNSPTVAGSCHFRVYVPTTATVAFQIDAKTGDVTTAQTSVNLWNATATTVSFAGGASTALNLGHASGTAVFACKLRIPSVAATTTEGDFFNDSTQKALGGFVDGIAQKLVGTIFTQTADKTVGGTGAETTLFGTGVGTVSLPANFFVAGKTIRIRLSGCYGTKASTAGTIKFNVYFGSTLIGDTGAQTVTDNQVAEGWNLIVDITARSTTSLSTHGFALLSTGAATSNVHNLDNATGSPTTPITVGTTAQALDCRVTWGTSDASNAIGCYNATVEVLN